VSFQLAEESVASWKLTPLTPLVSRTLLNPPVSDLMDSTVRRHVLGMIALLLLAAAAVLLLGAPQGLDANLRKMYGSLCLRAGLTLGAAWLAFRQVSALIASCSPRLMLTLALSALVVIVRPRTLPFMLVLVGIVLALEVAGWMLKPLRSSGKPPKR
jgi:hypothetical protein